MLEAIRRNWCFFMLSPRERSVFSVSMKNDVRLGNGGPPGRYGGAAAGWRATTRVLRSSAVQILHDLSNALVPGECSLCLAPLTRLSRVPVCESCLSAVAPMSSGVLGELCTRCGESMGYESMRMARALGLPGRERTTCRLAPPAFSRAVTYALYDDAARELLHLLKFRGQSATAELVLGHRLAEAILQLEEDAARELTVIPVPLSAARERERGFNQTTLLAESALKQLRRQRPEWKLTLCGDGLARTRETPHLFRLQPHERRAHLRGAFKAPRPELVKGREVLLLDDILTTGATARECARVLLGAGATKVWVATVARAQPLKLSTIHSTEYFTQGPSN